MISIQEEYRGLLSGILYGGKQKSDRTGTGTLSIFGRSIKHDMALGFPLLTTKKVYFNHAITELLWILQGRTDIKYLHKHNVFYWDPDYERSGRTDGTLGKIYGTQWRNFNGFDQLLYIIDNLKKNPSSRRLLLNSWNPADFNNMALPPCHYGFQVYTRPTTREEKITNPGKYRAISLMWNQRSVDTGLGLPFNIASYGALLTLIGHEVNMIPDVLIGSFGDTHLYKDHLDGAREQMERVSFDLPTIEFTNVNLLEGEFDYEVKDYQYHPTIKFSLSN